LTHIISVQQGELPKFHQRCVVYVGAVAICFSPSSRSRRIAGPVSREIVCGKQCCFAFPDCATVDSCPEEHERKTGSRSLGTEAEGFRFGGNKILTELPRRPKSQTISNAAIMDSHYRKTSQITR